MQTKYTQKRSSGTARGNKTNRHAKLHTIRTDTRTTQPKQLAPNLNGKHLLMRQNMRNICKARPCRFPHNTRRRCLTISLGARHHGCSYHPISLNFKEALHVTLYIPVKRDRMCFWIWCCSDFQNNLSQLELRSDGRGQRWILLEMDLKVRAKPLLTFT